MRVAEIGAATGPGAPSPVHKRSIAIVGVSSRLAMNLRARGYARCLFQYAQEDHGPLARRGVDSALTDDNLSGWLGPENTYVARTTIALCRRPTTGPYGIRVASHNL